MKSKRVIIMTLVLIMAMLACNAPASQGNGGNGSSAGAGSDGSAATITALAATIQAQNAVTATSPAPTDTPTVTLTPTPSVPMVTVSQTTNCRTGPGTVYDLLGSLSVGASAQVVGKYTPGNYWIIDTPGSSGTCWLWGQYATVSGNTSGLPEMIPPPTPTPAATATPALPTSPGNFSQTHSCTTASVFVWDVHVVLTWTDRANNEDGYYVYRGGTLLVTLAANSTTYTDDTTLSKLFILGHPAPSLDYGVQAFNAAGKSSLKDVSFGCP